MNYNIEAEIYGKTWTGFEGNTEVVLNGLTSEKLKEIFENFNLLNTGDFEYLTKVYITIEKYYYCGEWKISKNEKHTWVHI